MRIILFASILAFAAACAGPNPPANQRKLQLSEGVIALLKSDEDITLADSRIRCDQRRALGSNFRQRVCMLKSEYEAEREENIRDNLGADRGAGTRMGGRVDG